jgi:hypothetical protein
MRRSHGCARSWPSARRREGRGDAAGAAGGGICNWHRSGSGAHYAGDAGPRHCRHCAHRARRGRRPTCAWDGAAPRRCHGAWRHARDATAIVRRRRQAARAARHRARGGATRCVAVALGAGAQPSRRGRRARRRRETLRTDRLRAVRRGATARRATARHHRGAAPSPGGIPKPGRVRWRGSARPRRDRPDGHGQCGASRRARATDTAVAGARAPGGTRCRRRTAASCVSRTARRASTRRAH